MSKYIVQMFLHRKSDLNLNLLRRWSTFKTYLCHNINFSSALTSKNRHLKLSSALEINLKSLFFWSFAYYISYFLKRNVLFSSFKKNGAIVTMA